MKGATRGPKLTPGKRREIVAMHRDKKSFVAIEQEMKIKADTARKLWNRYLQGDNTKSASRIDRSKKLNNRDKRHLKQYVKYN